MMSKQVISFGMLVGFGFLVGTLSGIAFGAVFGTV